MSTPETAPPKPKAKILGEYMQYSINPDRQGKQDTIIMYQIDPLHTYQVTLPKDHPTDSEVETAIRNDWATRSGRFRKEIQL
jgi:hypothetical protein